MAFIRRLPGGNCALDLNGTITFITAEAAEMLGAPVSRLRGALPWEALPWMDTPVIEDHYRAAAISRLPRSFTAAPPIGRYLRFDLYPDDTGISVRITPVTADEPLPPPTAPSAVPAEPSPSRATALYQLMHLAAALTEAVHARDVVDQAADMLVPALGAQALALLVAEEQRLRIVGFRGYTAELMARYDGIPLSIHTASTHGLRTGEPLFFATADELAAAFPNVLIGDDMAAWAFLPLTASGRPIGTLILAYARPHPFVPGERAILTSSPDSSPRPWTAPGSTTPPTSSPTACRPACCRTPCPASRTSKWPPATCLRRTGSTSAATSTTSSGSTTPPSPPPSATSRATT